MKLISQYKLKYQLHGEIAFQFPCSEIANDVQAQRTGSGLPGMN